MKIIYIQTEIMLRKNMPSTYGWMHEDLHVLDGLDTILSASIKKLSYGNFILTMEFNILVRLYLYTKRKPVWKFRYKQPL